MPARTFARRRNGAEGFGVTPKRRKNSRGGEALDDKSSSKGVECEQRRQFEHNARDLPIPRSDFSLTAVTSAPATAG